MIQDPIGWGFVVLYQCDEDGVDALTKYPITNIAPDFDTAAKYLRDDILAALDCEAEYFSEEERAERADAAAKLLWDLTAQYCSAPGGSIAPHWAECSLDYSAAIWPVYMLEAQQ